MILDIIAGLCLQGCALRLFLKRHFLFEGYMKPPLDMASSNETVKSVLNVIPNVLRDARS